MLNLNKFPVTCYAVNDKQVVIVTRGLMGFIPTATSYNTPEQAQQVADILNERADVSRECSRVMTSASMFGWDIAAVANYLKEAV